jgi:DNA-binding transcriptional LysR family regulator
MEPRIGDLDLNLLRVFEALLADRQVTRAARRLNLTQSAVSNALARLRRLFDDELFVRTHAGMAPTALASEIAGPIAAALDNVRTVLGVKVPFDPAATTATFSLAMSEHAEAAVAPRLIARLRREAPGSRLVIRHAEKADALDLLNEGAVELAAGVLPKAPPHMTVARLMADRLVTLMRADHPAAGRLTRERYLAFPHVLISAVGRQSGAIDRLLGQQGLSRQLPAVVGHLAAVPPLLLTSDFLCTLPERLALIVAKPFGLAIKATPLEIPPIPVYMLWHNRHDRQPASLWLRGLLREIGSSPV